VERVSATGPSPAICPRRGAPAQPEIVARLRASTRARPVVEGFIAGMHRSPFTVSAWSSPEHRPTCRAIRSEHGLESVGAQRRYL
jgi:hypothetical protein